MGKSYIKYLFVLLLMFSMSLVVACDPVDDGDDNGDDNGDVITYKYDGTKTVAPYTVYHENGTKYDEYDSMFRAIHFAGEQSTSSNKMYVVDGNGLEIFKRQSKNQYWCYDGTYFVGSKASREALEWGKTKVRSYVLDGQGQAYVQCGTDYFPGSDLTQDINLELISGAYNYMFSKSGRLQGGTWAEMGYGYCSFNVRLSEATYLPTEDGDGWNAYIFVNGSAGFNCDLGLIGICNTTTKVVNWNLVRNCSHDDHKINNAEFGDSFTVLSRIPVTTMTYDEENKVYNGADDLNFECYQGENGWILTITNLRTNEEFIINEQHTDMHKDAMQYGRFLVAVSYCPVVGNVWNARCGAVLRNVLFDSLQIARWNENETYEESEMEEFYPNENTLNYGFSQAADSASYIYGSHQENGTYKSGNSYTKGQKYISFSTFYDGSLENE